MGGAPPPFPYIGGEHSIEALPYQEVMWSCLLTGDLLAWLPPGRVSLTKLMSDLTSKLNLFIVI